MENLKLLPHAWQSVGWGIIGGGIALLLYSLLGEEIYFVSTPWNIGNTLAIIGFLVIAFSRETFEDERINCIRFNTLGVTAIIYAVMLVAYPIMDAVILYFNSPKTLGEIVAVRNLFGVLPLYVIIFKLTVWIKNRDLSYEE